MSLFTADTIVQFMSDNIVKCLVQNPDPSQQTADGTVYVTANESAGSIEGKPGGKIYWLEFNDPSDLTDEAIEIYWVPYTGNDVPPRTMLGNAASFMFTAVMSGCSFGVGSYSGAGLVGVAHANAARSGDTGNTGLAGEAAMRQQKNVQQHMLYSQDVSKAIISFDDYMMQNGQLDLSMQSTTFGVHPIGGAWSFSTLKYKFLGGGRYQHYGVTQQVSGAIA